MIERDLGRIADSLEAIAELMKLKHEGPTRQGMDLVSPKEVKEVDDKDLDVKAHVDSKEALLSQKQVEGLTENKENKEKSTNRQEIMKTLDSLGVKYNKKAGSAYLKKLLDKEIAEELPSPEVVEPKKEEPVELPEEIEPKKEEVKIPTFEELKALVIQFSKDFGPDIAKGILVDEFKVAKLSQLPEEKYNKLIERIGLEIKKQNGLAANTFLN